MTTHSHHAFHGRRRRIDLAGLALFVFGAVFAVIAYLLVTASGYSPLIIVPSIVAATVGASHLTKTEAARD
jgi:hypothetical protein